MDRVDLFLGQRRRDAHRVIQNHLAGNLMPSLRPLRTAMILHPSQWNRTRPSAHLDDERERDLTPEMG